MTRVPGKNSPPEASIVRTNKDWIMIILGVALILFFFVVGYVAILQEGRNPGQKFRGPVKDPRGGMSLKSRALVSFSANDSIKNGYKIPAVFEGMPQAYIARDCKKYPAALSPIKVARQCGSE